MLYRCLYDNKILTKVALAKGICAGHNLVPYSDPKNDIVYKVAIAVPNESNIRCEAYDNHLVNIMRLGGLAERWKYERRSPRYEFSFFTAGRMITQMAREKLMQVALEANMDFICMYDDDMLIPYDTIVRLIEDMEQYPYIDVLAPLAFMRTPPHYAVIYSVKEGFDPVRKEEYYVNHWVKDYPRDKLVECDAVGFGMALIRMSMVRRMTKPYFFSMSPTGEDILFCVNAKKQAGARVFMDTRVKLGHIGEPKIIDEAYRDEYIKKTKETVVKVKYKYAVDEHDVTNPYNSLDR